MVPGGGMDAQGLRTLREGDDSAMSPDEIFRELLTIRDRLDQLGNDSVERVELEVRRAELHRMAAEADPDHQERLRHQAAEAERRVDEVERMRLDGSNMAGLVGIGGGLDPEVLKFVNDSIEKAHDLDALRNEAAQLRKQLEEPDTDGRNS